MRPGLGRIETGDCSMAKNVYTSLAGAVGLILLCMAALGWVSYADFLVSLVWL